MFLPILFCLAGPDLPDPPPVCRNHNLRFSAGIAVLAGLLCVHFEGLQASSLSPYQPQTRVTGEINSIGDDSMEGLMNLWLEAFQAVRPDVRRGTHWQHSGSDTAVPALMFESADIAPMTREPDGPELAAYAHQFHGDMMTSPVLVRVGTIGQRPAYLALNKRPDSPVPPVLSEFIHFVLSAEGQTAVAGITGYAAIEQLAASGELQKIDGFLAQLDPAIPPYVLAGPVTGEITSVGSDGMKSLVDRWMRRFSQLQPGVHIGVRWEHVGTLNGFYALLVNESDIAPMGRELWPEERAAYGEVHPQGSLLEIRVARGGFNTPQRTTAQAVFVNQENPISGISIPQLAAILQESPTITRWGQLGLTGDWANRPIAVYTPPLVAPNATSMRQMVLGGGNWNAAANQAPIADTATAIANDPAAIGFGGFEEGGPGVKALDVARTDRGPFIEGTAGTASTGRYPLTRYMFIRLNRQPGEPLKPAVKEYLRYILSREGQEPILYSGYFPLTAAEIDEELGKLD